MNIWLTRVNKIKGAEFAGFELELVVPQLTTEFPYNKIVADLGQFVSVWGDGNVSNS